MTYQPQASFSQESIDVDELRLSLNQAIDEIDDKAFLLRLRKFIATRDYSLQAEVNEQPFLTDDLLKNYVNTYMDRKEARRTEHFLYLFLIAAAGIATLTTLLLNTL